MAEVRQHDGRDKHLAPIEAALFDTAKCLAHCCVIGGAVSAFKWISGSYCWVVEVPGADPATFEVLGFNIARDKNHVWREDQKVAGADPATARSLYGHRVRRDANKVYHFSRIVTGADPGTAGRAAEIFPTAVGRVLTILPYAAE